MSDFLQIPASMSAGNSVLVEHITDVYESLTSGIYDVYFETATADIVSITGQSSSCLYSQFLYLENDIIGFSQNPVDQLNKNLNTVMIEYGMPAGSAYEGYIAFPRWYYTNSSKKYYGSCMTTCIKHVSGLDASSYKWILEDNFLKEWN